MSMFDLSGYQQGFAVNAPSPMQQVDQQSVLSSLLSGGGSNAQDNPNDFGLPDADSQVSGALTMKLRKLYLGETRPQADQWRRNYNAFMDGNTYNSLMEGISKDVHMATDPVRLSGFMNDNAPIIGYSTIAEKQVGIANGWGENRFRFSLVVDIYRNGRYYKTEFVSGYTDHAGIINGTLENSRMIDPNMIFRINQVTEAAQRARDPLTNAPIPLVSGSSQVLSNSDYAGIASPNQMISMRPSDVIDAVGKLDFYNGMQELDDMGIDNDARSFRDLSSVIGGIPQMSLADNALIPTFTSRMIGSLLNNSVSEFDPLQMDQNTNHSVAKARVKEATFSACMFVNVMNRRLANSVAITAEFSMSDLMQLDPTVDDRAVVFGRTFENGSVLMPDGTSVACIGEVSKPALAATCLANTVIQLMNKGGVNMLAIHLENGYGGLDDAVIQAANGMDYDGQLAQRLEMVKSRLIIEAIPLIKPDPQSSYEVDILADAFNDVFVQVSINGEKGEYLVPAFASSSFAPVVTNDMGTVITMADRVSRIVEDTRKYTTTQSHGILDSRGNAFASVTSGHEEGFGSNF